MKTFKRLQINLKPVYLITTLSCFILINGCSKDDNSIDIPSYVGTYTLINISSNFKLDPNASGQFNDNELIDNVACSSSITLNEDNSFSWGFLRIRQNSSSSLGFITSYNPITCSILSNTIGEFEVDGDSISFTSSEINNSTALMVGNFIEIFITEELIVEGIIGFEEEPVRLTLIYQRQN